MLIENLSPSWLTSESGAWRPMNVPESPPGSPAHILARCTSAHGAHARCLLGRNAHDLVGVPGPWRICNGKEGDGQDVSSIKKRIHESACCLRQSWGLIRPVSVPCYLLLGVAWIWTSFRYAYL